MSDLDPALILRDSRGARLSRIVHPGGWCGVCGYTWQVRSSETTVQYAPGRGCFAVCDHCWSTAPYPVIVEAFRRLTVRTWGRPEDWPAMSAAVTAEWERRASPRSGERLLDVGRMSRIEWFGVGLLLVLILVVALVGLEVLP